MLILAVRKILTVIDYISLLDYAKSYGNARFGQGNGTIAIENVGCVGTETSLLSCSSSAIFSTTCSHTDDAGVGCEGKVVEQF